MKTKISIIACFIFLSFGASAQNVVLEGWVDGWRGLAENEDRNINWIGAPGDSDFAGSLWSHRRRATVFPSLWQSGTVLLEDGSRFDGPIRYDRLRDVIEVNVAGKARIFRSRQISQLEIFQDQPQMMSATGEVNRKKTVYYSLPFDDKQGSENPKLFQVVVDGNTSLLTRWEKGNVFYNRKLYLLNQDGKITEIKQRRGSVIKGFDDKHAELKSFIKEEKLNMYDMRDLVTLVQEYNELVVQ